MKKDISTLMFLNKREKEKGSIWVQFVYAQYFLKDFPGYDEVSEASIGDMCEVKFENKNGNKIAEIHFIKKDE